MREPVKYFYKIEIQDVDEPEIIIAKNVPEVLRFYANFHKHTGKVIRSITKMHKHE